MTICTNIFLETDNFCTACGEYHVTPTKSNPTVTRKPAQNRTETKAQKLIEIHNAIDANPVYRTAKETIAILSDLFEIEIKVAFRNVQQSYFTTKYATPTIVLGYQSLDRSAKYGFEEYVSLRHMLPASRKGTDAAKLLAAHEFTHAIVEKENPYNREHHGAEFARIYRQVLDLVL